jgi:hypothetical protein
MLTETPEIPFDRWQPLPLAEAAVQFDGAPFEWALAGGYAVEQFVGTPFRPHSDIDIAIFRDEQRAVQTHLDGWQLYAADPPGTLRAWSRGEFLPVGIHDIWGHRADANAWEMQLMLVEADSDEWVSRRDVRIRGKRTALFEVYNGLPCVRIDVQLMYKAKAPRAKDEQDFAACLPRMTTVEMHRLPDNLQLLYPDGHPWLTAL